MDNIEYKAKVLIIDDNYDNVILAMALLKKLNLDLTFALNGRDGIQIARAEQPDVILLDVMMPEMDGVEVCKIIKENPDTQDISIIFVSAKTEIDSVVSALGAGGVDYITKPFRQPELIARLKTHLLMAKAQRTVKAQNILLEKLNKEKDQLMQITVHDLKNPLSGVLSILDEIIEHTDLEQLTSNVHNAKYGINTAMNIILDIMDAYSLETGKIRFNPEIFDINQIIAKCISAQYSRANFKHIQLISNLPSESMFVELDKSKLFRIFDNLLSNALKFSHSGSNIYITSSTENQFAVISIKDEGPGLNPEENHLLFKKFTTLSAKPTSEENSTGLGLFIVKTLTNAMNGEISCHSTPGVGTEFVLKFPLI